VGITARTQKTINTRIQRHRQRISKKRQKKGVIRGGGASQAVFLRWRGGDQNRCLRLRSHANSAQKPKRGDGTIQQKRINEEHLLGIAQRQISESPRPQGKQEAQRSKYQTKKTKNGAWVWDPENGCTRNTGRGGETDQRSKGARNGHSQQTKGRRGPGAPTRWKGSTGKWPGTSETSHRGSCTWCRVHFT